MTVINGEHLIKGKKFVTGTTQYFLGTPRTFLSSKGEVNCDAFARDKIISAWADFLTR